MHSIDRSVLDWAEQMDEHTTVSASQGRVCRCCECRPSDFCIWVWVHRLGGECLVGAQLEAENESNERPSSSAGRVDERAALSLGKM